MGRNSRDTILIGYWYPPFCTHWVVRLGRNRRCHFTNVKIVYHSNRAAVCFGPRLQDSLVSKQTDTNDAGDDDRDIKAIDCIHYGVLEVKAFPALPHMPYETAWFNQFIPAILLL